jgi:hypothetical protein
VKKSGPLDAFVRKTDGKIEEKDDKEKKSAAKASKKPKTPQSNTLLGYFSKK